ncbi:MAG: ABC transporter ATP-binding protein, partial [Hydrogenimonas sp.]
MHCHSLTITAQGRTYVDIAFSIHHSLALVGESGSGKSLTLKALLGMLPKGFEAKMVCESDFP